MHVTTTPMHVLNISDDAMDGVCTLVQDKDGTWLAQIQASARGESANAARKNAIQKTREAAIAFETFESPIS